MGIASTPGNEGRAHWSLRLLGDFQLTEQASGEKVAVSGKRERVLLAYLALSPNGRQPRRKLVTLLWGDAADEASLENLRTSVFNLRKTLGDTERRIIASEDREIVLDLSAFEADVLEFRRLAAASGVAELEEAAKLYTGDFLEGLSIESEEFESWRREEATRFRDQNVDVLNRVMSELANSGETERAIETGLRMLRLEPLNEVAVRRLMRLYAGSDRRGAALEVYRTLAETLRAELNAQPKAETRAVHAEIAQGNDERTAAVPDAKSLPPSATMARASLTGAAPSAAEHFVPAIDTPAPIVRPKVKGRTIGWFAAGGAAAAAVIALFMFMFFASSSGPTPTGGPATVVAATPTSAIALAVLPFANVSSDPGQDFFSDGLTDEITTALAKIPDLGVVARTSASEFKGQARNIRIIGEQLGATHLIEGSVRRAGTRVRITAQLIEARNGVHVWAQSYDRELADVFAIQEEIATSIAGALKVQLGLAPGQQLVFQRAVDPESYQQFLRARALLLQGRSSSAEVIAILEPVVARNPDYAPAWRGLAYAYYFAIRPNASAEEFRRLDALYRPKMMAAGRRAIELDPNSVDGHIMQAGFQFVLLRWALAEDFYSMALRLDPNHPDALNAYSNMLLMLGRVKEGLAMKQQLHELEPLSHRFAANLADALWQDGQDEAAIAIYKDILGRPNTASAQGLARIYASMGRYEEAADVLSQLNPDTFPEEQRRVAAGLLRSAPAKYAPPERPPALPGILGFIYLHIGVPERALDLYEQAVQDPTVIALLWHPSYAPVRKTERFKAVVRTAGLVDYWRVRGWPDLCRPISAADFVCD